MKRTLKRESKVLEIVRREAIGAGGSSLVRGCSVVHLLVGRAAAIGECSRASVLCSFLAQTMHSVLATSQHRLHVVRVADGRLGIKGPGGPASQPCPTGATQRTCHRRGRGTN